MRKKDKDWVGFGEVAHLCGMQRQYLCRYINGWQDYPNLGEGLRFRNIYGKEFEIADYHEIEMHKDDVEEFVKRVQQYRKDTFQIP